MILRLSDEQGTRQVGHKELRCCHGQLTSFPLVTISIACASPVASTSISRAFLPVTCKADKPPLETKPVARDNNTIFTLKPEDQTFVLPYSTDNRSDTPVCGSCFLHFPRVLKCPSCFITVQSARLRLLYLFNK